MYTLLQYGKMYMNKLALLYGAGMYETLYLTKHEIKFHERYHMSLLTSLYQQVVKVLKEQ